MSTTFANRIKNTARAAAVAAAMAATALGLAANGNAAMYGDPEAAAQYWQPQHYDNCGLMAVADVIGQLTGYLPTEEEIIAVAMQTPSVVHPGSLYIPPENLSEPNTGQGILDMDAVVLLEHYQIDGILTSEPAAAEDRNLPDTGLDAMAEYLAEGHKIIAAVDADIIWGQDNGSDVAGHLLVVTGIDTTRGVVHLNDSGNDDGRNDQVTTETFTEAWATSDETMIVTVQTS
jgi:hypothetical protein